MPSYIVLVKVWPLIDTPFSQLQPLLQRLTGCHRGLKSLLGDKFLLWSVPGISRFFPRGLSYLRKFQPLEVHGLQ